MNKHKITLLVCILVILGVSAAFFAVSTIKQQNEKRWLHDLAHGTADERSDAAAELAAVKSEKVLPGIIALAESEDPMTRLMATRSLGALGMKEAIPALEKKYKDEVFLVRLVAWVGLDKLGDRRPIPYPEGLAETIKDPKKIRQALEDPVKIMDGLESAIIPFALPEEEREEVRDIGEKILTFIRGGINELEKMEQKKNGQIEDK